MSWLSSVVGNGTGVSVSLAALSLVLITSLFNTACLSIVLLKAIGKK